MPSTKMTPTEERIYRLLCDGMAHTRAEVKACIGDEYTEAGTVRTHIYNLRKKIAINRAILCEMNGGLKYRMVQLITKETVE